jgi:hypothetical protein
MTHRPTGRKKMGTKRFGPFALLAVLALIPVKFVMLVSR